MNYQAFFNDTDTLHGRNFRCMIFRTGGQTTLTGESRHPALFVLQGAMELSFSDLCRYTIGQDEMISIDRQKLTQCSCKADTVILEYTPPLRLANYFANCKSALETSCSSSVPILPPLREWIIELLKNGLEEETISEELCFAHRRMLAKIMLNYPRSNMGDLFLAFRSCAYGNCTECR